MILYLDTSSLVKLYIDEPYSAEVWQWAIDAYALATWGSRRFRKP
jgi:hypothetical protein